MDPSEDLQKIHAEAMAKYEAKIDAALREIEASHPELHDLLTRELRNLRADARLFQVQRDCAENLQKRWEKQVDEAQKAMWAAESSARAAHAKSNHLRVLLYDLQKEVATWPRPKAEEKPEEPLPVLSSRNDDRFY